VIEHGFASEIDWQDSLSIEDITETDFLREGAWVILSSGMRESVIRSKFPAFSEAFYHWDSAMLILSNRARCRKNALSVFRHTRKIEAVISMAEQVGQSGFEFVLNRLRDDDVAYLQTFSYLGPATSYHLAKNIGLDVVKPDRHLVRVTKASGFKTPSDLCQTIADAVGEKLAVVDLVIWRFATLKRDYVSHFA
jgi:hypothetical protein